jgi:hypothetical protein
MKNPLTVHEIRIGREWVHLEHEEGIDDRKW